MEEMKKESLPKDLHTVYRFEMQFKKENHYRQTPSNGGNKIHYLAFEIACATKLVVGNDTLLCNFSHYENNMGVTPYDNVLFEFESEKNDFNSSLLSDMVFIYDDRFFGLGKLVFKIQPKVINTIPILKLQ